MISTKNGQKGRFGNKFIRNMIIYLVSNKLNIETKYENDIENNIDYFLKLGFKFTSKDNNELKKQKITSSQIIDILNNKITYLPEKHYILDGFYQNPEIIKHINYYFTNKNNFYVQRVILNNPYQNRYKNNKDIFIHLRAGDIFSYNKNNITLNSDNEQLSRAFFNMIKNSIESIQEKREEIINFSGKIDIVLNDYLSNIDLVITDDGLGFGVFEDNIKDILNPYFTTKESGTGLGLAIVNKTINDHNGSIDFIPLNNGASIKIKFIK